ncbi:MAG: hypothetical protein A2076_13055 [Geobacteraceae bacterium GWC2_53_11]|nr:MAG: hypothetical protein A2076_13055 [Geobacteraceae bacterium GWC2_53_11]
MEFNRLTPQDFEKLCERLLVAEGYILDHQERRARDIGVDFLISTPDGQRWVGEAKHTHRTIAPASMFRHAASQLRAAKKYLAADGGLLLVSMTMPTLLMEELEESEHLAIWDGRKMREILSRHPSIISEFAVAESASETTSGPTEVELLEPRATELIERLEQLQAGKEHFKLYEDLCIEILNYVFIPPFTIPDIQSRSEDDLDIRDAVYPINNKNEFWDQIKNLCSTWFAVAEFKNYTASIGQNQVESIQQYLYHKAMRNFGLLCSRLEPSESAKKARRRAWVESEKLIVFLSDEDMKDLIIAKSFGQDPSTIIQAQLQEFFLCLCP